PLGARSRKPHDWPANSKSQISEVTHGQEQEERQEEDQGQGSPRLQGQGRREGRHARLRAEQVIARAGRWRAAALQRLVYPGSFVRSSWAWNLGFTPSITCSSLPSGPITYVFRRG